MRALWALRSALYVVFLMATVVPWALAVLLLSIAWRGPRLYWAAVGWLRLAIWGARVICGVRAQVSGLEHVPTAAQTTSAVLLAPKHQSTWETFFFPTLMPHPLAYVFKKELLKIPFFGWAMGRLDMVHIDRSRRTEAWNKVAEQGRRLFAGGTWVIMFPEGTRSPDGLLQKPKPGVGLFACRTQVPVVPARLFGSFEAFDRRGRLRFGAPVTVVFGRPIPPAVYDDPAAGKERYQVASERIMAEIAKLQPPPVTVI